MSATGRRNDQHDCAGSMAESAIDARPDLQVADATLAPGSGRPRRWSGTDRVSQADPGGELARASGDEDGSSVHPRRPSGRRCQPGPDDGRSQASSSRQQKRERRGGSDHLSSPVPRTGRRWPSTDSFRGCVRILGADWEWRSAASCGQMWSGAAIVAVPSASEVLERHQTATLVVCLLSSGRRGRRFKSGHPDQVKHVP